MSGLHCRNVLLRVTLLAAGFVIGPSGTSVRDVTKQTGADIRSWTESKSKHPCRVFMLEVRPYLIPS